MFPFDLGPDIIVPLAVFAIPIVAITGGIVMGVVRALGRQRAVELAQRERIAAIERGIDPATLPPMTIAGSEFLDDRHSNPLRRAQGLLIAGLITLFAGIGVMIFLGLMLHGHGGEEEYAWAIGLVPGLVGVALMLSARIVWPRGK